MYIYIYIYIYVYIYVYIYIYIYIYVYIYIYIYIYILLYSTNTIQNITKATSRTNITAKPTTCSDIADRVVNKSR